MRFALFIAIGLGGVAAVAAARPTSAPREAAREVLKARGCGACHDSAVSTEHSNALAVYDLHDGDWPAKMSDERLPKLMTRLRSAPAADREVVKRFITAELSARAHAK
jgi:hypothetical protein